MSDTEKSEEQKQIEAHLLAVGKCINQWAMLENSLFRLFKAAMNTRDDLAAIIFYKDHAFRMKLDLTDEIVEALLGVETEDAKRWVDLCKRIRTESKYRNLAAHFALWRRQSIVVGPEGLEQFGDSGLRASKQPERLNRPREVDKSVTIEGLEASVRAVIDLQRELADFAPLLANKLRSQP